MKNCDNCRNCMRSELLELCDSCVDVDENGPIAPTHWTAPTNADRIRSMTDAELAEWLGDVSKSWYDEGYTKDFDETLISGYPSTATEWFDWLKQEVDE